MSHARLTFLSVATATLIVSGCAGPTWMLNSPFSTASSDRAETKDESEAVTSPTASTALSQGPSLSQVLDDIERLKHANPSDLEVIRSAIEDEANLLPPQYQQMYKDQMLAVAAKQQQTFQPAIPPTVAAAPVKNLGAASVSYEQPASAIPTPTPNALQTPLPLPVSSPTASVIHPSESAVALLSNGTTTPPAAAVTTSVSDSPRPQPLAASTPVAIDTTPEIKSGQWSGDIEQALTSLSADLSRPNLDRDERARLEIARRLLYVATNQRDNAVTPIDQLDEDEAEYWKHQLLGLMVSIDAEGKHPTTRRAALALRHHRAAIDHLANVSTLDVSNLSFCQEVFSFGKHRVFDSYSFRAKDEVVLYVEVDNFAAVPRGDSFETELHGSYEILDDAGRRVANVVLPVDKEVSNNRRRDYFIAYLITMPTQIASGSYRLRLTVEDVIGKKSNHATVDFRIQ
jgi:hypothetical protein